MPSFCDVDTIIIQNIDVGAIDTQHEPFETDLTYPILAITDVLVLTFRKETDYR